MNEKEVNLIKEIYNFLSENYFNLLNKKNWKYFQNLYKKCDIYEIL